MPGEEWDRWQQKKEETKKGQEQNNQMSKVRRGKALPELKLRMSKKEEQMHVVTLTSLRCIPSKHVEFHRGVKQLWSDKRETIIKEEVVQLKLNFESRFVCE